MGKNLEFVWTEFLTLSWAVSCDTNTPTSRVENSAQVKFVCV